MIKCDLRFVTISCIVWWPNLTMKCSESLHTEYGTNKLHTTMTLLNIHSIQIAKNQTKKQKQFDYLTEC